MRTIYYIVADIKKKIFHAGRHERPNFSTNGPFHYTFKNMIVLFILVSQQFGYIRTNESLSNKDKNYFN
jgi:hypothetical protein